MQRHRVLVAFGIAWLTALLLSWAVYKKTSAPQKREVVQAVAAAKDLPLGKIIDSSDLKLVTLDRKDMPNAAFSKIADVAGRAAISSLVANELVLDAKLAAKGGGESMPALIEPGMRAVSVQVNEISGVSGFIQPGTRVDVLFTRIFSNGDAASTTILQNLKVIAYGRLLESDKSAKVDVRDATKTTVATLLVTGEQAEKLALAIQRGRIQLVLRNPLDNQIAEDREPVISADLGIPEPVKPGPARASIPPRVETKPPVRAASGSVEQRVNSSGNGHVVHVYRGSKMSEDIFE